MWLRRDGSVVVVRTPAKVNLFLEVIGKRPDGYHELASLMVAVGLYDTLEIRQTASGEVRLECDVPGLSTGPDNLVVRAAELIRTRHGVGSGCEVRLSKRIPMQAGLAGGSSDAAATLLGLDALYGLGLGRRRLGELGAELGSDVTFFFHGPAAWCTGRGEVVEPLVPGAPLDLVLVSPEAGLSTAGVFRELTLTGDAAEGGPIRRAFEAGDVEALGKSLYNRLQGPAERLCPEVRFWLDRLRESAPLGAMMSGSGSTAFALARDAADALRIARGLRDGREARPGPRVAVVRSCF